LSSSDQPLIACEQCGTIYRRHALSRGETATCARCGTVLWRYSGITLSGWLALALAAFITFIVANAYPVIGMTIQGMMREASLLDAVSMTWNQGHRLTAIMTGMAGFALPLVLLLLLLWVLGPLAYGREPLGFKPILRILGWLRPWCMVPVFLLGVLVSVVKLAAMASITPEPGLFAFGALTVLLTMLDRLSPHAIWRLTEVEGITPVHVPTRAENHRLTGCHCCGQVQAISEVADDDEPHHCVRCDTVVHYRKPNSLTRTWALLIAAIALYIPANVLPIMNIQSLFFGDSGHTILGGVVDLWQSGSWDIALVVFIASIVVPLVKMLALITLASSTQRGSQFYLRQRSKLYQMVEFIGQWSMLDVFVVILLAALAHFQGLMEISAGPAAGAFGLVVVLTMLAAMHFDPRIAWDQEVNDVSDRATAKVEGRANHHADSDIEKDDLRRSPSLQDNA
jgi:paraquat-inducible protein A